MWQPSIGAGRGQQILACLLLLLVWSSSALSQSPATSRVKTSAIAEKMSVAQTTVPELYWLPVNSVELLLKRYGLAADPSGEGPLVISQYPPPGTGVPAGTHVRVGLGTPRLVLSASSSAANINQQLTFNLGLEPTLPQPAGTRLMAFVPSPLQPRYALDWGDGGNSTVQVPTATHAYSSAGKFNVSAVAEVGPYKVSSNQITITVTGPNPVSPAYRVGLEVVPSTVEIGQDAHATAFVSPEPSRDAFYTFYWGDDLVTNQSLPVATHHYSGPEGTRNVQVTVTIDDHDFRSNPILVHITGPPTTKTNNGENSNTTVNPQDEVAVPKLYWLTSTEAGAFLQKSRLRAEVSGRENGIVINQNPQPGQRVPPGTGVTITLGQPQLSLSTGSSVAKVGDDLSFVLTLAPAPPGTLSAHYLFNWNDGTNTATDSTFAAHHFNNAGTYDISATAQIGTLQIPSNQLTVTIEGATPPAVSYKLGLQVSPYSAEVGQQIQATAFISPSPTAGVEYTFTWGDGSRSAVQSPDATHTYNSPPGTYLVQVLVSMNGRVLRSNPAQIRITPAAIPAPDQNSGWPAWQIVAGIVVAIALVVSGVSLFRSRSVKPSSGPQTHLPGGVSVTGGFGAPTHEIQNAKQIRKKPALRIRGGSASSMSMQPEKIAARKRSASNA